MEENSQIKAHKKALRKMKNRESARQSREKQKRTILELKEKNEALEAENKEFRERIDILYADNAALSERKLELETKVAALEAMLSNCQPDIMGSKQKKQSSAPSYLENFSMLSVPPLKKQRLISDETAAFLAETFDL